jgi:hypothetical protein
VRQVLVVVGAHRLQPGLHVRRGVDTGMRPRVGQT